MILYENTVPNKFIIDFSYLSSTPEDQFFPFEDIHSLKIPEKCEECLILISSTPIKKTLDKVIKPFVNFVKITLAIRNYDDSNSDDGYECENWQLFWASAVKSLDEKNIEPDVRDAIFSYYYKLPSLIQRRIYECIYKNINIDRYTFTKQLENTPIQVYQTNGRKIIESKQKLITRAINTTLHKNIDKVRYAICVSDFLETAFQLMEHTTAEVIVLCRVQPNCGDVDVTIVSKFLDQKTIFDEYVLSTSGHFKRSIIDLKFFTQLCE